MTDFDDIPIATTEGHRPPSPATDRLLIGLAAVALAGGLLVAAGNFLSADEAVSVASGSPEVSPKGVRTPRPTASPRELAVEQAPLPSPMPQQSFFSGWIRATSDLVVHLGPTVDSREMGVLAEGAIAQVDQQQEDADGHGWLYVNAPSPQGWVATIDQGTPLAERFSTNYSTYGGSIWTVAAGDEGFLAVGTRPGRTDLAEEEVPFVSADGASWRTVSPPEEWGLGWGGASIAWGPAGWLSATMVDSSSGPQKWISHSTDGRKWVSLGRMQGLPADSYLNQLVASDGGYLLATSGSQTTFWFSSDGVTWRETGANGISRNGYLRVVATRIGFYAWEEDWGEPAHAAAEAAFSADGHNWSLVQGGPGGSVRQIVSVGDRLLGLDVDPESGAPRVWSGVLARGSVAWLRDPDADASFSGTAPTSLVSDGQRVVAFGWDRSTEDPLVWTLEATGWARSRLPEAFGGIPRLAVVGPAGVVVVGSRPTSRGMNPIFWHETSPGSWAAERSPVMPIALDPSPAECGPAPTDVLEFIVVDHATAAACLGDEPMTFRAWSSECDGCYGGQGDGTYEPKWLMGMTQDQLYLSPIEDDTGGWWTQVVIHPSLEYDRAWRKQWLEVTGHFDDPAASECRWLPNHDALTYYEGRRATVEQCRQQFVVTEVSVVSGP